MVRSSCPRGSSSRGQPSNPLGTHPYQNPRCQQVAAPPPHTLCFSVAPHTVVQVGRLAIHTGAVGVPGIQLGSPAEVRKLQAGQLDRQGRVGGAYPAELDTLLVLGRPGTLVRGTPGTLAQRGLLGSPGRSGRGPHTEVVDRNSFTGTGSSLQSEW